MLLREFDVQPEALDSELETSGCVARRRRLRHRGASADPPPVATSDGAEDKRRSGGRKPPDGWGGSRPPRCCAYGRVVARPARSQARPPASHPRPAHVPASASASARTRTKRGSCAALAASTGYDGRVRASSGACSHTATSRTRAPIPSWSSASGERNATSSVMRGCSSTAHRFTSRASRWNRSCRSWRSGPTALPRPRWAACRIHRGPRRCTLERGYSRPEAVWLSSTFRKRSTARCIATSTAPARMSSNSPI